MFNAPDDIFAPELSDFFQNAANEFLIQPDSRAPDFVCAGQSSLAKIYVVDAPAATLTFFRQIMEDEPERFTAMNRIFHRAQSGLQGVGWAVTRFGGVVYLSLSIWDEIYVKCVPRPLSAEAVATARRFDRFLDSTISNPNIADDPGVMPEILAQTLCSASPIVSHSLT